MHSTPTDRVVTWVQGAGGRVVRMIEAPPPTKGTMACCLQSPAISQRLTDRFLTSLDKRGSAPIPPSGHGVEPSRLAPRLLFRLTDRCA